MKRKYALIILSLIMVYLLIVLISVDYNLFEFKISIKTLSMQALSLKEMRNSNIYKAYKRIESNTSIEEIDSILNKKSRNILGNFETWDYPYGYVSAWYSKDKIFTKVVHFKTPYTREIDEKELYSVFECNSLEKLMNILGEPGEIGEAYDRDGKITEYNCSWGIKTSFSQSFIDDTKKNYDKNVSLPLNDQKRIGKFRLNVSVKANNEIESFSLVDYEKQY